MLLSMLTQISEGIGHKRGVSQSCVGLLLPENDALQVERVFYDPSGWDSNPEHVLLGW